MADRVYNVLFLCTGNSARNLPIASIDRLALQHKLDRIGKTGDGRHTSDVA